MYKQRLTILFLCQVLFWTMTIVGVTLSSLIGLQLASNAALATLPMAVLTLGNIFTTLPLSIIMQKYSRRLGFSLGAFASICGGLLACYAIIIQHFWLFCAANILLGIAQGSAMYYRLAATDGVEPAQQGRVIAWVMSGGIVAAIIAPTLSVWSKDLLLPNLFAGSYLMVSVLGALIFLLCLNLPSNKQHSGSQTKASPAGRATAAIIKQPIFITAITNAALGHGVMILIMVSTPLAIMACGFTIKDSAHIIQWHVLGMFIPSFFSGKLIDRFGAPSISLCGIAILIASNITALLGIELINFYISLFLLGIGWNFMYTAGTKLIASSHTTNERGQIQGLAELSISIMAAIAAFSSGVLLSQLGWAAVNIGTIPLLIFAAAVTFWYKYKHLNKTDVINSDT